ncbi:MAG: hypothetical protein ACRYG8_06710 [Janthinobacterium lividum]
MSTLISDLLSAPVISFEILPTQLRREIEEHAVRAAQRALQKVLAVPPAPKQVCDCAQMAVCLEGGPNGEVYSVTVIVQRKPPHD